jgi:DNA-damage-inducible protein D
MSEELARQPEMTPFDVIRHMNGNGVEWWSAREIQQHLGYEEWRSFKSAIERAQQSCRQTGQDPEHHFVAVAKVIIAGKGAKQRIEDFALTRYACYLIAQNGDPSKSQVARAQQYFAVQTRRQELADQEQVDLERLEKRQHASLAFRMLSGAARQAGVTNPMFGIFHDAGYRGLYGGKGAAELRKLKGIPEQDKLLDRMNSTELAANTFRMTQTREKLKREGIVQEAAAIEAHHIVGKQVREAIAKIGGTMPEDVPAAEPIRAVRKRVRGSPKPPAIGGGEPAKQSGGG